MSVAPPQTTEVRPPLIELRRYQVPFDGRNTAGAPVYDRDRGRVADGVDGTRVSDNSGAESNIVAAEVLLDEAIEAARSMADPFAS